MATKKPQDPDPRIWQQELGGVDTYWGGNFDTRNPALLGATMGNFTSLSDALQAARQSELLSNARYLRQNAPQLRRAAKAVQRIANQTTQPTALSEALVNASQTALSNPLAQNPTLARLQGDGSLLSTLEQQAAAELANNGRLSPEAQMEAEDAARQAYAARGLGTSAPAALSEVLNRDRYVQQRQDRARAFASGVTGQQLALSDLVQGAVNSGRSLALGTNAQEQARLARAGALRTGAQQFRLGTNPALMAYNTPGLVPTALSAALQTTQQADVYPNILNYAANVNDFNANAEWSKYFNNLNRYYASQYGGMGAYGGGGGGFNIGGAATGALSGAATGAALGSVVPGIGTAVGALGGAVIGGVGGGMM